MTEVALWSFRHTLISQVNDFLEVAVLVLVDDEFPLFPGVTERIKLLTSPDKGSQLVLYIDR